MFAITFWSPFLDRADPATSGHPARRLVPILAALFQLSDGAQSVAAGMLRGLHDTRIPMLFAALGYWVVGLATSVVSPSASAGTASASGPALPPASPSSPCSCAALGPPRAARPGEDVVSGRRAIDARPFARQQAEREQHGRLYRHQHFDAARAAAHAGSLDAAGPPPRRQHPTLPAPPLCAPHPQAPLVAIVAQLVRASVCGTEGRGLQVPFVAPACAPPNAEFPGQGFMHSPKDNPDFDDHKMAAQASSPTARPASAPSAAFMRPL